MEFVFVWSRGKISGAHVLQSQGAINEICCDIT